MRVAPSPAFLAAAGATVTGLALYLPTAARGVGFIDRGELAAVAVTLGIAHPTGYPTLTLLGHLIVALTPLASRSDCWPRSPVPTTSRRKSIRCCSAAFETRCLNWSKAFFCLARVAEEWNKSVST